MSSWNWVQFKLFVWCIVKNEKKKKNQFCSGVKECPLSHWNSKSLNFTILLLNALRHFHSFYSLLASAFSGEKEKVASNKLFPDYNVSVVDWETLCCVLRTQRSWKREWGLHKKDDKLSSWEGNSHWNCHFLKVSLLFLIKNLIVGVGFPFT